MAKSTHSNYSNLDLVYMFLNKTYLNTQNNFLGDEVLKFNPSTHQLFFCLGSKKNTMILIAEWVGSVLLVRNWARDKGVRPKNKRYSGYSLAAHSNSILYYIRTRAEFENVVYLEIEGVIKESHREEAKLINATLVV